MHRSSKLMFSTGALPDGFEKVTNINGPLGGIVSVIRRRLPAFGTLLHPKQLLVIVNALGKVLFHPLTVAVVMASIVILNDTKRKIHPSENRRFQRNVFMSRTVSSGSALAAELQNRLGPVLATRFHWTYVALGNSAVPQGLCRRISRRHNTTYSTPR